MRQELRVSAWVSGLLVALFAVILVSAAMGPVRIDPLTVAKILLEHTLVVPSDVSLQLQSASIPFLNAGVPVPNIDVSVRPLLAFDVPATSETIVFKLRLPRILLGAVVGFALAAAGTVMQGFFRNPMADPSIVGVSSGAALGAVATIAFPLAIPFGLQAAAFAGALVTAFAVYVLATENGRTPVATLLLAGVAVQTFLGAVISYTLLQSGDGLREAVFWLMGHLHASTWASVTVTIPFVGLGVAILFAYTSDLNILLMGEEDAHSLGVEVERTKRILLAVASIVTAAAVAVSGVIGFVGLIVPHVMRLLVGPDHRILLPTSAIAGSVFLVATDTVARAGAAELPVGIVTAALGAPFFLYLLRRREVHRL
ncbi:MULTISPECIES: vitamin B12 ABC transporter permease BtuC [unclassified Haladaptatus]|uniref:vitamin B12 ABC transporter permease BtuC n=1 Tax=unclassified Haladaptatus TaxID=2622732 RepID=UPI0023E8A0E0|nr:MULTISPECIES: vitamin B12 ABC transporter permease BtuC [unclassified Haladaptatus]